MKHNHIRGFMRLQVAAVALAALLTAGCAATGSTAAHSPSNTPAAATTAQLAARGVESAIETIPWPQVGPGWTLALWKPVTTHRPGETAPPGEPKPVEIIETLYLVNPAGGRYPITTFPKGPAPKLIDWSADRSHALFYRLKPGSADHDTVISVDLRTGQQSALPLDHGDAFGYARPDGTAVLIGHASYHDHPGWLKRVDLAGNEEVTYPVGPDFPGGALPTSDGAQAVVGASNGLALLSNDGASGKELPLPNALRCSPVRWWSSTVVLAWCGVERYVSAGQLWQIPVDGAAPTALTAVNAGMGTAPGFAGDYGDSDAWALRSGTFLQSLGACGASFLSRLTPDGHTTRVKISGVSDSVWVVGVNGDKLVLVAKAGCNGGTSLLTYDPATKGVTVLLGPTVNGGSVTEARAYRSQP